MKLSENLMLSEVIRSESAKRRGIDNMPTAEHVANLKVLAEKIFQPIRENFRVPIHISSGYRSRKLNAAISGSATSQHCTGEALDIDMDGSPHGVTNLDIFNFIKDKLDFDQVINEFPKNGNPDWVHVSYRVKGGNRKQVLKAVKSGGKTTYIPF
jgi:zinc D-Ala-D-Ala carboxypeptidase